MASKRQQIVDQLVARMQLITLAGGYRTNLGQNVFDWEIHFQQEDLGVDGAISVCDLPAEAADTSGRSNPRETVWRMPVQLRMFFGRDTPPSRVRDAIADVNDALRIDDRIRDSNGKGLAMITRPVREGLFRSEDSYELIGGIVEIEVQFITQKFNSEE